jgi:hypothetical protein
MITIGFSTRKHNPNYIEQLQKTVMYKDVEIIEKVNNGEKSLTQVYNEILNESSNDIVVLIHDDLEFETKNWGDKIIKHFKKNSDYGILGLAGTKYLSSSGMWWELPSSMYGIVNHTDGIKKWASTYSKDGGNKIDETIIVDGLFLAIHKKRIKHKFDENFDGFHFYDMSFCLPNFLDDVGVGVIYDVRVTHLSVGQTNEKWEENRKKFSEMYFEELPIDINDQELCETFIFVHDQNLILSFEDMNKFRSLYSYKYVFLGDRPVDKIQHLDNVIFAKNYEDNLEQYPLFTSYTGWYILWKYNLIKTKYVNLFEYDIVLDEHFSTHQSRFLSDGLQMVGYVPFPMAHYQFVANPEWNEHILPTINKLYKFDVLSYVNRVVSQNPKALWSSTSNTTFRLDIFNEYMKWFQPIANQIKETKTCGHAHERSITYFTFIKNKKMMLTNGLLKHMQLDSHKTQGHFVNQEEQLKKLFENII